VVAPAYTWAGLVAYSRMHLGVHYPTDLIAGAVLGSGTAILTHKANQWLQNKKKTKSILQ
jgi:membrane-associated phospholipid phosphatase